MIRHVLVTVAQNIAAPLAVYGVLLLCNVPTVWALVGSAAVSAVVVVVGCLRTSTINALGAIIGVQFLLSIGVAVITGDPRLVLAKDAAVTAVIAVGFAATISTATPILARIHRDFERDTKTFDERWAQDAEFRRDHRRVTAIWAGGLLLSAIAVAIAAYLPSINTAVILTQVIPVPIYLGLIAWTQRRFSNG